ncbi:MAG: hydratase [Clostridia bacterium]|nr:hydratase [Clostridia bacterium]
MVKCIDQKHVLVNGQLVPVSAEVTGSRDNTMAWEILSAHCVGGAPKDNNLRIKFDGLASHDITYVGIIQTARASGMEKFPIPYVLTNCHNSLCAVGGTINEDDHLFGLSATEKYGGIYVPAHLAVIHQYMREMMAGCGKMLLGSDSHTRYGAIGTIAMGEGGPELVKQLLGQTYDVARPEVVAIYLHGELNPGVGPQDVALALVKAVFDNGFVKNRILEFFGPGVAKLSMDTRIGIDVMTTETACLSSIWETDDKTENYLKMHGRGEEYRKLQPKEGACYDKVVDIDLSTVHPMIALPFHPSNAYEIREFLANPIEILKETEERCNAQLGEKVKLNLTEKWINGEFHVDQCEIAGCSGGTFENICAAAYALSGKSTGNGACALNVYPSSQPVFLELMRNGAATELAAAGAILRTAFCGPCFGAGDVPANKGLSIRHSTRNFASREGSKPGEGQIATVALMDARSIAATAARGGVLTSAEDLDWSGYEVPEYNFDSKVYENRVYNGYGKGDGSKDLIMGPNIADWPKMHALPDNLVLECCADIRDSVTTTDELIPSGETSSYRSNPYRLSEFTLSRRVPGYVAKAKVTRDLEVGRDTAEGTAKVAEFLGKNLPENLVNTYGISVDNTGVGSFIYAVRPGDGSAREQAASCQKVLGGWANVVSEYATKRYRSNLINWGMLPLQATEQDAEYIGVGDFLVLTDVRNSLINYTEQVNGCIVSANGEVKREITFSLPGLTEQERKIILAGCLINKNRDSGEQN